MQTDENAGGNDTWSRVVRLASLSRAGLAESKARCMLVSVE
jgi:hypothetical protein